MADIFARYRNIGATADGKQGAVDAVSAIKRAAMRPAAPAPEDMFRAVVGMHTGQGRETETELEQDTRRLNPLELQRKYGAGAADMIASQVAGMNSYNASVSTPRTAAERVGDAAITATKTLTNIPLGIAAVGAGIINDDTGVWASQQLDALNKEVDSHQSDYLQNNRRVMGVTQELSDRDNTAQFEKDLAEDGTLIATGKRWLNDAVSTVSNIYDNPAIAEDTVAAGVGSLAGAGLIAGGLRKIGAAAISSRAAAAVISPASTIAPKVMAAGGAASVPAAIGIMEGSGAYTQTTNAAYARLKDRTDLTEDQKVEMANAAGLRAAAIQAPVSAATGVLVSKIERNPLKLVNTKTALANIGREALEETTQSITGQVAQNIGIRDFVDPTQSLSEGVGEQSVYGAIGGIGSTAVVQAPGVALRTAIDTAKLPFTAAGNAIGSIVTARANKIDAQNQAVQDKTIADLNAQAIQEAPAIREAAQTSIDTAEATPEQKEQATSYADRLMQLVGLDPTKLTDAKLPQSVKSVLAMSTDKLDAMRKLASVVTEAGRSAYDRMAASNALRDMVNEGTALEAETIPEPLANDVGIGSMKDVITNLGQSNTVQSALKAGTALYRRAANQINKVNITPELLTTPEGTAAVDNVIGLAETNPDIVDTKQIDKILFHDSQGTITLTPAQRNALRASSALVRANIEYNEKANLFKLPTANPVSREIQSSKSDADTVKKSAKEHMLGIAAAYNAGDRGTATERLADLRLFAQHMQNKVIALNQALKLGKTSSKNSVSYRALTEGRKFRPSTNGMYVNPYVPNSVALAQQVAMDAEAVASVMNSLADVFPDLGVDHIEITPLDPRLNGPADQVVRAYAKSQKKVPAKAEEVTLIQPEVQQTEAPAPVDVEPVVTLEPVVEKAQEITEIVPEPIKEEVPVVAAVEEDIAPEREPITDPHANLIGSSEGDGMNLFRTAFKQPEIARTRLIGEVSPLTKIRDVMASATSLRKFIGTRLNRNYSDEVATAYAGYLNTANAILDKLNESLNGFLNENYNLYDGKTLVRTMDIKDHFVNGLGSNRWKRGMALNITETNEDGDVVYNQALIESAVLASLQWYLKLNTVTSTMDRDGVHALTDIPLDDITDNLISILSDGITTTALSRSLAQEISNFWGLSRDSNAPVNYSEGILEGVAKEILVAMNSMGANNFFELNAVWLTEEDGVAKPRTVNLYKPVGFVGQDALFQFPSAIESAVFIEPTQINYIGEAPQGGSDTQLRNPLVKLTEQQIAARQAERDVPHFINVTRLDLLMQLGEETAMSLFGGGGDLTKLPINKNHKRSLEGQNLTIQSAFRTIQNLVTEVQGKADLDGKQLEDMPIHHDYEFTSVNRMQMQGTNNPQSSKLMREIELPTGETYDLTDSNQLEVFNMGIAQALGIRVHNQTRADTLKELANKFETQYIDSIEFMSSWLKSDAKNVEMEITANDISNIKREFGNDLSPAAFFALLEYVKATETKTPQAFVSPTYFEADGVANGVSNAMVLFQGGDYTDSQIKNYARGGLFIGQPDMSLNIHRSTGGDNGADLYEVAADSTAIHERALLRKYQGNKRVRSQILAVRQLLSMFATGITLKDDTLTIKRGATKNPLTITLYGSGAAGIAGNIRDEVVGAIYEKMSEASLRRASNNKLTAAQAMFGDSPTADADWANFLAVLSTLTITRLVESKGSLIAINVEAGKKSSRGDFENFTFSRQDMKAIQDNILHAFVGPLREGVSDTVGKDTLDTAELIKQQTQSWSLIGSFVYKRAYTIALEQRAKKDPNFRPTDLLSVKEERAVLKSIKNMIPFINSPTQGFMMGSTQSTDLGRDYEFGQALGGEFKTKGYLFGPGNAGVSGIPYITIGYGDGQTIQNVSVDPATPKKRLTIFDGIHSTALAMNDMGLVANQAVMQAWTANPLQDVTVAFAKFLDGYKPIGLDIDERKQMVRSVFPKELWDHAFTEEQIIERMTLLADKAQQKAKGIEARHNVFKQVALSVDQMAGAGSPAQQTGILLLGSNEAERKAQLNIMLDAELDKLNGVSPAKPVVEPIKNAVRGNDLLNLVKKIKADRLTKSLLMDVVKSKAAEGYKIVTAPKAQITNLLMEMGMSEADAISRSTASGFTVHGAKTIYMIEGQSSPETMLHELIHAATFDTVLAHYEGTSSPLTKQAIYRLEGLMAQFKKLGSKSGFVGNASLGDTESILNRYSSKDIENSLSPDLLAEIASYDGKAVPDGLQDRLTAAIDLFESQKLRERFNEYGISDKVHFRIVGTLRQYAAAFGGTVGNDVDGAFLRKDPSKALASKPMVLLAADMIGDPEAILDHEMIHAFRQLGLVTAAEWQILVDEVQNNKLFMDSVKSRYVGLNKIAQQEEAVADLFAAWRQEPTILNGKSKSILTRITKFLGDVASIFRKGVAPKQTAEDIFNSIMSGEFGTRGQVAPVIPTNNIGTASLNNSNAYQSALDEMERRADSSKDSEPVRKAAELNEFMAWSLANSDLATKLSATKVEDRFVRLARATIQLIKKILWGGKRSAAVKDDMFTNLRFNTNIIMRSQPTLDTIIGKTALFHDTSFGNSARLMALSKTIKDRISSYVDPAAFGVLDPSRKKVALARSARVASSFVAHGFPMTSQEFTTFTDILRVMATNMELNPNAATRIQELYAHVTKNLSFEDFMVDRESNDPAAIYEANQKFGSVMGKFIAVDDATGRSFLMPAFLALAITNDGFRTILNKMPLPKTNYGAWNTVDAILDNIGDSAINNMSRLVSGEGVLSGNVKLAVDNLMSGLLETEEDRQWYIEKFTSPVGGVTDRINDAIVGGVTSLSNTATDWANNRIDTSTSSVQRGIAEVTKTVAGLLNEANGQLASEGLIAGANRIGIWRPFHELLNDLIGRTASNASVYDLIKIARSWGQQIRQQFREKLPDILNKQFSRQITDAEWTAMHSMLGQTDIASLRSMYSMEQILEFIQDRSKVGAEITALEDKIKALSPNNAKLLIHKSKQLAMYMTTKNVGDRLLRNADAIANLLGQNIVPEDTSKLMVDAIDHMVTLLALDNQSNTNRALMVSLSQKEAKGLGFVTSYLVGLRADEQSKATGNARFNHYKGNVPINNDPGVHLVVANITEMKEYLGKGYIYLGPYRGSPKEHGGRDHIGYFFAPVSGRPAYAQGIIQNIQPTVSGVDQKTGFSVELTAGRITSPAWIKRIQNSKYKEPETEQLLPVFDSNGKLFAYERSVDPNVLTKLNRGTDLAKIMGIWAGRQIEEAKSFELNKLLIDRLRAMYDTDRLSGRLGEYVDVFKNNDGVLYDASMIISDEARAYIRQVFPAGFMIRKDMLNDALGYRQASIGDVWTGTSRWSEDTQESIRKMLVSVFGNKAYQRVVNGEKLIQNIVSDLRVTIVVRSMIVPLANIASNMLQLMTRGVPAVAMFKAIPKKTAEIESYVKSTLRLMEAEAELRATEDPITERRLKAELQSIRDSHRRLSIWPLIQAGEFNSISDAGAREDVLLTEGKLFEYLDNLVNKLPKSVRTAGRYAVISRDTALFKGLQKTVDYGDFIAKAILYDDLTKRQGTSKEHALARVTEEFVNYDRLPGRGRGYVESMGLLWFWNFKIRSAKVAVSMLRNNPLYAAMALMAPIPTIGTSIGLPVEDNLWAILFDGRLDNSMGIGQALNAPGLLPAGQII